MSKYAVSGVNSILLDATADATAITAAADPTHLWAGRDLLGKGISTGRSFWLRSFWAYSPSAAGVLTLADASAGTTCASTNKKIKISVASTNTTFVDFPKPGLHFKTGCIVARETAGPTAGFQPGEVGGSGYEQG